MFHLISFSFSLICILLSTIVGVNCHLLIHESNVWIPIFNNNLRAAYFFYTENTFYTTNLTSQTLNTDPNAIGEESSANHFTPAYSHKPRIYLLQAWNSNQYIQYNYTQNGFVPIGTHFNHRYNTHRLTSFNDSLVHKIALSLGYNITNSSPVGLVHCLRFYSTNRANNWTALFAIETTVRSFKILQTFNLHENIYSFGFLTFASQGPFYFISQISNTRLGNIDITYFTYKELHSILFHQHYGSVDKVRFVDSFSLMNDGSSFSLLVLSYYRNERDHIAVFPFNSIINDFERPIHGCRPSETLWNADLFNEFGPECYSHSSRYRSQYMLRTDFRGQNLTGILTEDWTRIIDFVPLALDVTPGYVFLVLSSDSNFTRYRYSIHFVNENYSVSTHPNERVFAHRNLINANRTISQIYYYGFDHPRVIITLNQFTYSDSIILCPFLSNSCIDCFTTKIYDPNGNFLRYCQWTRGDSLSSGECSIGDENSIDSRVITPTNHTENPCFSPTNIQIDSSLDEPIINLNFDLLGFHSAYANIFPLTITLVQITTPFLINNCSVRYNHSKIFLNCDRVNPGQYRLSIVMFSRQGPFETRDFDNLITYSDPFTIGQPPESSFLYILLIISKVCSFIISVIALVVFHYLLIYSLYFKTKNITTPKQCKIAKNESIETKSKR